MSPIPVPTPRMQYPRQFRLGEARRKSTAPATPERRRIVAASAAAAAAGIMMNCHDPRCRARRKEERGSKRIRVKNPRLYKAYKARRYPNPSVSSRSLLWPLARLSPGSGVA